jgi:hypothetical protein
MSPDVVLGGMEGEQVAGGVDGRRIRHEKRRELHNALEETVKLASVVAGSVKA